MMRFGTLVVSGTFSETSERNERAKRASETSERNERAKRASETSERNEKNSNLTTYFLFSWTLSINKVYGWNWNTKTHTPKPDLPSPLGSVGCGKFTHLDGKINVIAWGTYNWATLSWDDKMYYIDAKFGTSWNTVTSSRPVFRHGFPSAETFFYMNAFETTLINFYNKGQAYWTWWKNGNKFMTLSSGQDVSDLAKREWNAGVLMHLKDAWNCIPQSKAWQKWVSQAVGHPFLKTERLVTNEGSNRYINKEIMDLYKSCDGYYHFKLVYKEHFRFNEWKQTSNPFESETVEGYKPIQIGFPNRFGGLRNCPDNLPCILRGNSTYF